MSCSDIRGAKLCDKSVATLTMFSRQKFLFDQPAMNKPREVAGYVHRSFDYAAHFMGLIEHALVISGIH